MSIDSRIPCDRSSSTGAGSFGFRKLRKIDELLPTQCSCTAKWCQEAIGADERLGLAFEPDLIHPRPATRCRPRRRRPGLGRACPAPRRAYRARRNPLPARANRPDNHRGRPSDHGACSGQSRHSGSWCGSRASNEAPIISASFWKSSTNVSCFLGCARLSRDSVCTALMPESGLVDVHRVQQWLVVTGLELVGADQEAVWVFAELRRDVVAGESVQRRLSRPFARRTSCSPENATIALYGLLRSEGSR